MRTESQVVPAPPAARRWPAGVFVLLALLALAVIYFALSGVLMAGSFMLAHPAGRTAHEVAAWARFERQWQWVGRAYFALALGGLVAFLAAARAAARRWLRTAGIARSGAI